MTSISDTNVVNAPGGLVELGYSQITSSVFPATTTIPATTDVILPMTVVCDGSPVLVEFWCCYAQPASDLANRSLTISLFIDGSENQRYFAYIQTNTTGNSYRPVHLMLRTTPSAGVHTFAIKAYVSGGTGTIGAGPGGGGANDSPAFLRVSKIIQASQLIVQTPNAPLVTSLPSNAIDGQEVRYLADNTNGIIWNFRYRAGSSSTYKWEFIGGASLVAEYNTDEAVASSSFTSFTNGPNLTLPLAGDYTIGFGASSVVSISGQQGHIGLKINSTNATNSEAAGVGEAGQRDAVWRQRNWTALPVSTVLTMQGRVNSGQINAFNRNIVATPIRVSA